MSGGVLPFGAANYAMMTQLIGNATATRRSLATLTEQASTGMVSQTYAGLGSGARVSLDLNPEIAAIGTWQGNIAAAQGSMQVTQTTLSEISQVTTTFNADLGALSNAAPQMVTTIAAAARQALTQVAGLLDTSDGTTYVFAGQDTANPPVPNAGQILSSGFSAAIQAAIAGLATNGAAATAASVLAIGASNAPGLSPFSAALSHPAATLSGARPTIQVGPGQFVSVGVLASANAYVASGGSPTTGSYMRDVMTGLAAIGALSESDVNLSGFPDFVGDIRALLGGAISALNEDAGALGEQQNALTSDASTLSDTADALKTQLGNVQDVAMAPTASALSLVQTQLQASYQVIADMDGLSLVNYL